MAHQPKLVHDLDKRLQHLEDLLVILNNQQGSQGRSSSVDISRSISESESEDAESAALAEAPKSHAIPPGQWQAVLDDISELRSFLLRESPGEGFQPTLVNTAPLHGSVVLFNMLYPTTRSDLISALPPKNAVDEIVAYVMSCGESAVIILHAPTFLQAYNDFWMDTDSVSLAWLAKLFALTCLGALFLRRQGVSLPEPLASHPELVEGLRVRSAQALIMSNYTRPGPDKMEALIVYMASEYFKSKDTQLGVSMIVGIIVRLSMSLGYHRDPSRDPSLSFFECEMIRRRWAFITPVERMVSFQMGLPSMTPTTLIDTRRPLNILDSDIDPAATALPPERPVWEPTPISFIIAKGRIAKVFATIVDSLNAGNMMPYKHVMQLDTDLQDASSRLPPFLEFRPVSQSYLDPMELIMKRFFLDLLTLKGRCMLHREYLTYEPLNKKYSESRIKCVAAARQILRHQADIYREIQPSGILHANSWFLLSLTASDFLLAAMIIGVCISQHSHVVKSGQEARALGFPNSNEIQASLPHELMTSQRIWMSLAQKSSEAGRAAEAMGLVLAQASAAHEGSYQTALTDNAIFSTELPIAGAIHPTNEFDNVGVSPIIDVDSGVTWDTWDRYFGGGVPISTSNDAGAGAGAGAGLGATVPLHGTITQEIPTLEAFSNLNFDAGFHD